MERPKSFDMQSFKSGCLDFWPFLVSFAPLLFLVKISDGMILRIVRESSNSIVTLISIIVAFVAASITIILTANTEVINSFKNNTFRSFKRLVAIHSVVVISGLLSVLISIILPLWFSNTIITKEMLSLFRFWLYDTTLTILLFVNITVYLNALIVPREKKDSTTPNSDLPPVMPGDKLEDNK